MRPAQTIALLVLWARNRLHLILRACGMCLEQLRAAKDSQSSYLNSAEAKANCARAHLELVLQRPVLAKRAGLDAISGHALIEHRPTRVLQGQRES